MIAALAGALGTTLIDLTEQVAIDLRRQMSLAPRAGRTLARAAPARATSSPSPPRPGRGVQAGTRSLSARSSRARCPSTWSTIP